MDINFWETMPPRGEVLDCLESGLQFLRGEAVETVEAARKLAIRVLANIIIEHLDISGYAIARKPAGQEPPATQDEHYGMAAAVLAD
jgi:hypothetical protein